MYIILVLFLFCLVVVLISILLSLVLKEPQCGGYVDPNSRYCNDNGKIIQASVPETCDATSTLTFTQNLLSFVHYIDTTIEQSKNSQLSSFCQAAFPDATVYNGMVIFALPELLKILPSDFGQNYTTPYGIISFFETTASCIDDINGLCEYITGHDKNQLTNLTCREYLTYLKQKTSQCPFPITDHSSHVFIQDIPFFNSIGLLGAFSLQSSQAVIVFNDIPVQDFSLNYWSYNVYIADNLNPDNVCSPFRQTNVASTVAPFNMFHAVANAQKPFNPFTGQGTIRPGHVRFFIVMTYNKTIGENIKNMLLSQKDIPYDCVHVFELPAGNNTMPIDPELPNPNGLSSTDPLFQPNSQRLCSFLRLSLSPRATDDEKARLTSFINHRDEYAQSFQVVLMDFQNNQMTSEFYSQFTLPPMIAPMTNESEMLSSQWKDMCHRVKSSFSLHRRQQIPTRYSTLNIFAPRFRNVRNTKQPYRGGFQAIQLAGNAQGDNYDAQYRTSKATCLGADDVFIAFCVNHASLHNCIYNSINVVDVNKAYGYDAVAFDSSFFNTFYIVLIGRSQEHVNSAERMMRQRLSSDDVLFSKIIIRTGVSIDGDIPLCHQVLIVERIYMNVRYMSNTDTTTVYDVSDLFGTDLQQLMDTTDDTRWKSLKNVVGPDLRTMIEPLYIKVSFSSTLVQNVLFWILFGVILCLLILSTVWLLRKRKES